MMNKKGIVKAVKHELNSSISYFDIFSVVNILIDELKKELLINKKVNIPNFGKLILKTFKSKKIINVQTGKLQASRPYTSLRFSLSKNILKQIIDNGEL